MKKLWLLGLVTVVSCTALNSAPPQPSFSGDFPSANVAIDGTGRLVLKYTYAECIVPSKETKTVTIEQQISNTESKPGVLSALAVFIGYLLKTLIS